MSILICTAFSSLYEPLHNITSPSKKAYAKKWGLTYVEYNHKAINFELCRERVIFWRRSLYSTSGWIFFTGSDVAITNYQVPPTQWIDDNYDFIIAKDRNGLQSDVFFLRSSARTINYLNEISKRITSSYNEQQGLVDCLETCNIKVKYVPSKEVNCYAPRLYPDGASFENPWAPGSFCLHLAALPNETRLAEFPKYLELCKAYMV